VCSYWGFSNFILFSNIILFLCLSCKILEQRHREIEVRISHMHTILKCSNPTLLFVCGPVVHGLFIFPWNPIMCFHAACGGSVAKIIFQWPTIFVISIFQQFVSAFLYSLAIGYWGMTISSSMLRFVLLLYWVPVHDKIISLFPVIFVFYGTSVIYFFMLFLLTVVFCLF
jgi:hypothetical protein